MLEGESVDQHQHMYVLEAVVRNHTGCLGALVGDTGVLGPKDGLSATAPESLFSDAAAGLELEQQLREANVGIITLDCSDRGAAETLGAWHETGDAHYSAALGLKSHGDLSAALCSYERALQAWLASPPKDDAKAHTKNEEELDQTDRSTILMRAALQSRCEWTETMEQFEAERATRSGVSASLAAGADADGGVCPSLYGPSHECTLEAQSRLVGAMQAILQRVVVVPPKTCEQPPLLAGPAAATCSSYQAPRTTASGAATRGTAWAASVGLTVPNTRASGSTTPRRGRAASVRAMVQCFSASGRMARQTVWASFMV
eukprot:NODE_2063_length_2302_cov_6.884138.p1 GENE.NODE_2063_length_2302_cov_6.884138~~NODE_2063_length_2302_cov_6.884138.p1  ORF type:complete len:317 (+),score=64.38 NODE_2063_length_2302_cov_6.884138:350-1300(+)